MLFRPATSADIGALVEIRAAESHTTEFWTERIAGYMAGTYHPQKALAPRVVFVAGENGTIVGFAAGHLTRRFDCDAELQWMNVIESRRGNGIASELIRMLANWFVEHSAYRVCVNVDPANIAARRLYGRHRAEPLNEHWLIWTDVRRALD